MYIIGRNSLLTKTKRAVEIELFSGRKGTHMNSSPTIPSQTSEHSFIFFEAMCTQSEIAHPHLTPPLLLPLPHHQPPFAILRGDAPGVQKSAPPLSSVLPLSIPHTRSHPSRAMRSSCQSTSSNSSSYTSDTSRSASRTLLPVSRCLNCSQAWE